MEKEFCRYILDEVGRGVGGELISVSASGEDCDEEAGLDIGNSGIFKDCLNS